MYYVGGTILRPLVIRPTQLWTLITLPPDEVETSVMAQIKALFEGFKAIPKSQIRFSRKNFFGTLPLRGF